MPTTHILMSLSPRRETNAVGWHPRTRPYDERYLEQIVDPSDASPSRFSPAIPSPFARLHFVDAAFAFLSARDKRATPIHSGTTVFHRAASDCLDVLELLFNWNSHVSGGVPLQLTQWNSERALQELYASRSEGQRLLGYVLDLYLKEDAATGQFSSQGNFYLITLGRKIIACSSPLTLFATSGAAAAVAAQHKVVEPATGRPYFERVTPLHERDHDFQGYLHRLFYEQQTLRAGCPRLHSYLRDSIELVERSDSAFGADLRGIEYTSAVLANELETISDAHGNHLTLRGAVLYQRSSAPILNKIQASTLLIQSDRRPEELAHAPVVLHDDHSSLGVYDGRTKAPTDCETPVVDRVLPDLGVKYPFLVASDFIEDRIIRLPFGLNVSRFHIPATDGFEPDEPSYLCPLKAEYFRYFRPESVGSAARLTKKPEGVLFELTVPTVGKEIVFRRFYYTNPRLPKAGLIVDAHFDCAVFPFVKVKHEPADGSGTQIACPDYRVMVIDGERAPAVRGKDCFDVSFLRSTDDGYETISSNPQATPSVTRTDRSDKSDEVGSTYYEVRGACFDAIEITAFPFDAKRRARTLLMPRWEERAPGQKAATFAIDFGTTNSHVAWASDEGRRVPRPLTVAEKDMQVVLLNAPREGSSLSESARYDEFPAKLTGTMIRAQHEFVPSIIGGTGATFAFPMRTATSEVRNTLASDYRLLGNINISFVFEKNSVRQDEEVSTNLKWSVRTSEQIRKRAECFIREILLLIQAKALLNECDPAKTQLVWFRPLSFDVQTRTQFDKIWSDAAKEVLGIPVGHIQCVTESEAPYYYHQKAAHAISSAPVLCVDIGGGSSDVVFFEHDRPEFGTSFAFAGNALWGTGYDVIGASQNGVVRKYGPLIEQRIGSLSDDNERLRIQDVCQDFVGGGRPSEDIVSFFFAIDKHVGFSEALSRDGGVKFLIFLHYAAIMFHCAQVMKCLGMRAPEYVCFSGRGAKGLDVLDLTPSKRYLAESTNELFERAFGQKLKQPVKILSAAEPKEATCNGGLLKGDTPLKEPDGVVEVGSGSYLFAKGKERLKNEPVRYSGISQEVKDRVVRNVSTFVESFFWLDRHGDFKDTFGISIDAKAARRILEDKVEDYLDFGLKRRLESAGGDETVGETLFFYPLIHKLFELGTELVNQDS